MMVSLDQINWNAFAKIKDKMMPKNTGKQVNFGNTEESSDEDGMEKTGYTTLSMGPVGNRGKYSPRGAQSKDKSNTKSSLNKKKDEFDYKFDIDASPNRRKEKKGV